MKELLEILKNYKLLKWLFWKTVIILLLTEATFLIFPLLAKKIVHILEIKWDYNNILFWWILGILLVVINSFFWYLSEKLLAKLWAFYVKEKNYLYKKKLLDKSYEQIIEAWTWKLISRFSRWLQSEASIFLSILEILTNTVFKIVIISIIFIFTLPSFFVIVLFFIISMHFLNTFVKGKVKKYVEEENKMYEDDTRLTVKIINDFLLVKIFNKQNQEIEKSNKIISKLPKLREKIRWYQMIFYVALFFFLKSLEYGAYLLIWYFVLKWEMTIATLIMITGYLWSLWNPIDVAIKELNRISQELEVYKKLQEFINKPNEIKNWEKEYIYKSGEIKIKDLEFAYNKENKIFDKLNLEFLPGKKNALVGHSGWWKSTIIKILLRLYDYQKWEILVDGQNLKDLKIESFYKYIGYLPQEPWIFDGTIRENLEYAFTSPQPSPQGEGVKSPIIPFHKGDEDKNNKEKLMWEALEKAQIADMVRKLEKGLDTEVGEKWVKLSWWEKQRLAIARIFLKNPKIIILDEPTSALDSISENKITKALDELIKWKTAIIIAHRLQTVMHSDKIIVLKKWKIESMWKHNELMQKSKIYKQLVDLQNGKVLE